MPLRTDAPRNTTFVRRASGASAGTTPGCFSTGNDSPVMLASLTRKSLASRIRPSAGIRLPAESTRTSPGTSASACTVAFDAVAHDAAGEREALLQLLDRRGRAVLLVEAEQRGADHDREDDRRVDPLGEAERDRGGEDQDQDERAFDLPPEQAQRTETLRVLDAVRAHDSESLGGARRREPVRTRAERGAEIAGFATPVRRGGVWRDQAALSSRTGGGRQSHSSARGNPVAVKTPIVTGI